MSDNPPPMTSEELFFETVSQLNAAIEQFQCGGLQGDDAVELRLFAIDLNALVAAAAAASSGAMILADALDRGAREAADAIAEAASDRDRTMVPLVPARMN